MIQLDEVIEFIQDEIALAKNDDVPVTAEYLEATLWYLIDLEGILND